MTQTIDPYDELTAMFLTDPDPAGSPRASGSDVQTTVEVLVVGHLPVRAGVWMTPYADAIARGHGPSVLIRLDGDEPTLQIMRDPNGVAERTLADCRSLREAIFSLGGMVRSWIVRPSARVERQELALAPADRLTILTSADQAAAVSTYLLVKDLVHACDGAGGPRPEITLAVIGRERAAADDFVARLNDTTSSCLEVGVPLLICLPQIDAGIRASQMASFPGRVRPTLDETLGWIDDARRRETPAPAPVTVPDAAAGPAPRATRLPDGPGEIHVRRPIPTASAPPTMSPPAPPSPPVPPAAHPWVPEPSAAVAGWDHAAPPAVQPPVVRRPVGHAPAPAIDIPRAAPFPEPIEGTTPSATIKLTPRSAAQIEAKSPSRAGEPDCGGAPVPLASYVGAPAGTCVPIGVALKPMRPRCPGHERVELACDAAGRIHLLGREDTLREMDVVATWSRRHHELLTMACPEHQLTAGAPVVRHVFTDDPLRVADLHGADAHLHLLTPVTIEGRQGWYAAELNRPGY